MMSWRIFLRTLVVTFGVLVIVVYALILLVDPYRHVPFSLPLARAPISTNQRFAYPTIARDRTFDSIVMGSSTMRLLNPDNLDQLLNVRFANLAMNSATAYEQMRIHDLFLRHHPDAKYVIVGIDDSWCKRSASIEKYTFREFPEWMYDDNRWNDLLYLFNDKALENTVRLLELISGNRQPKYEKNGYRDFTLDFGTYDYTVVAKRLYPTGIPVTRRAPNLTPDNEHPQWQFAAHDLLAKMLAHPAAKNTTTVLVLAPMHGAHLAKLEPIYRECKNRIVKLARAHGARIMDFMLDSEITRIDENYWDPLHFRAPVARLLEEDIAAELRNLPAAPSRYRTYCCDERTAG